MRAERQSTKKQQQLRDAIARAQGYTSHEAAVKALAKKTGKEGRS